MISINFYRKLLKILWGCFFLLFIVAGKNTASGGLQSKTTA
jgi:hypothetical protein